METKLSKHFEYREFFPEHVDYDAEAEVVLTQLFCLHYLDLVRDKVGPLFVNAGKLHYRGWRDAQGIVLAKSHNGSDHAMLSVNPLATGACDVNSAELKTEELYRKIVFMEELGMLPLSRVLLYETARGSEWVHISWPPELRKHADFARFVDKYGKTRVPGYLTDRGKMWRYWKIVDHVKRFPIDIRLVPAI